MRAAWVNNQINSNISNETLNDWKIHLKKSFHRSASEGGPLGMKAKATGKSNTASPKWELCLLWCKYERKGKRKEERGWKEGRKEIVYFIASSTFHL